MSRGQVARVMALETAIVSGAALVLGILFGVGVSQLMTFFTASIFKTQIANFHFFFSMQAFTLTVGLSLIHIYKGGTPWPTSSCSVTRTPTTTPSCPPSSCLSCSTSSSTRATPIPLSLIHIFARAPVLVARAGPVALHQLAQLLRVPDHALRRDPVSYTHLKCIGRLGALSRPNGSRRATAYR